MKNALMSVRRNGVAIKGMTDIKKNHFPFIIIMNRFPFLLMVIKDLNISVYFTLSHHLLFQATLKQNLMILRFLQ